MALRKKSMAVALVSAMLLSSTAFSGTAVSKKTVSSLATVGSRNATLRFSWWGGDDRNKATLDVINQFEKKYPKISINAEYGSSDGYNDKLATELAAGTAPDIVQIDPNYFPTYYNVNKNYFVDFKNQSISLSGYDANYLKNNGCYSGKQLGLPTGIAGCSIIENTALAVKTGINLTKQYSWNDLITMGKKVNKYNSGDYLLAANLSYLSDYVFRAYLTQITGRALIDDSKNKLTITQQELTRTYSLIKSLYDNHVIPPESHMSSYENDNIPKDPNWISGKYVAGLCVASTADVLAAAAPGVKFTAAKLPQLKGQKDPGYVANCPQIISVTSKSQYIPEAVAFLNYFFNNATAAQTLGAVRSIPAVKSARDIVQKNNLATALTTGCVNTLLTYKGTNVIGSSTSAEVKSILSDGIAYVAYGRDTPSQESARTYSLLNNYIKNHKK
jgi:ABC-type sugar transport system, periplasmic component